MNATRIIDLSLPIIHGGGFGKPAQIRYSDHKARGKALCEQFDIEPADIDCRANAMEAFSYLTTHTGTHFDAPYHYTDVVQGKPALTIDQIPLEWCFGPGVWLDLSHRPPGTDIEMADIKAVASKIDYTIKSRDIVLIKTGAGDCYGQESCDNMNAGMTRDATLWLADQGVKLVGIDACCWDRPPQMQLESLKKGERKGRYMEGHRAAGERGICILEWITNLELLPPFGFTVYAFPVKIARAGGSWVRVVAMMSEAM